MTESQDDIDEGMSKLLTSRTIRAVIIAMIGLVIAFNVFGINVLSLLTAPTAIVMAARVLKLAKGEAFRAPRILAWVAIVLAVASLFRPLLV